MKGYVLSFVQVSRTDGCSCQLPSVANVYETHMSTISRHALLNQRPAAVKPPIVLFSTRRKVDENFYLDHGADTVVNFTELSSLSLYLSLSLSRFS